MKILTKACGKVPEDKSNRSAYHAGMRFAIALVLLCLSIPVFSFDCATLRQLQKKTYGFQPHLLPDQQREQKTLQMDRFWDAAKADPNGSAVCLEQLLKENRSDAFFQFDGASLLMQLGNPDAHLAAIKEALESTSLDEVQPDEYIRTTLYLAAHGQDISRIAQKYLEARQVTTYLPAHGGYELDRQRGALLLYGSLPPEAATKLLAAELNSRTEETRDTAAILLALMMTEESFRVLSQIGGSQPLSQEAKDNINAVLTRQEVKTPANPKYDRNVILAKLNKLPGMDPGDSDLAETRALDQSLVATLKPEDMPALQSARKRMIQGVSDESIDGYLELSRLMLMVINHLDLYKQYRH